jgi:hypothetical protein
MIIRYAMNAKLTMMNQMMSQKLTALPHCRPSGGSQAAG